ncbi:LPXTG cell wall anchor domain-containing protein [uncultured Limosilactobacillus sp.]|uniref:LPXTG cell wall anchor domain-containing protein n=1 Tax=uncultured Limosilactobacillus sp. TaxID=2837629 RepID=UPI0025F31969|nr:LPXTG cell wall anchor domain-containing protein [uncultured Limosilactobacillus sp.]
MKTSKWQNGLICLGVMSGVMLVTSVKQINAATVNGPTTIAETKILSQTKRVVEMHSSDGVVNQQQTDILSWKPCKYGEFQRTSSAKLPQFKGYSHQANGMLIAKLEKIDIPVTVYHVDYFVADGKYRPTPANCVVDLKDQQGKVYVRHLYNVPYDQERTVTLSAPTGLEFVQPSAKVQHLLGRYGEHKVITVRPVTLQTVHPPRQEPIAKPQLPTAKPETSNKLAKPVANQEQVKAKHAEDKRPVHQPTFTNPPKATTLPMAKTVKPETATNHVKVELPEAPDRHSAFNHAINAELKPVSKMVPPSESSEEDINKLMAYNHPVLKHVQADGEHDGHTKLPQTGNHGGQLLAALGVALLAITGLLRTNRKR